MTSKQRIAIFASGNGSNAEEIIKYFQPHPSIEVALVLSNNKEALVLERAARFNIPTRVFTKSQFRESDEVVNWLNDFKITHVVLAGFLWLIPKNLIHAFPGRIVNIHPALLPKFGGKGMYGLKVHEAVKLSGEKETGITIHSIDEKYDEGEMLFQISCIVNESDSPQDIATRVNQLEYEHYPKVIEEWILKNPIASK
ncbi:MAG TPA: phosphoribosylglycinamide formyltransferase [Cyclobacteriaceae bacterium]